MFKEKILLRVVVFLVMFSFLMAHEIIEVFVPKGFNHFLLPYKYKIKFYTTLPSSLDDKLWIFSYKDFPFLIENRNVQFIMPLGNVDLYIISKKEFFKVTSIANVSYPAEILLNSIEKKFIIKNVTFDEFKKRGDIDAWVDERKYEGYYNYPLSFFGINFNKYYLVGDRDFLKEHKKDIEFLYFFLKDKYRVDFQRLLSSVVLSSYYLHTKIDMCKKFFKRCDEKFKKIKILRVAMTPNWPPFHFLKDGKLSGISIDFWKILAKRSHIDYVFDIKSLWGGVIEAIKEGSADATIDTSFTPDRAKYAIFTKPYVEFPLGIYCNKKITDIKEIKSIAVGYNFTAYKMMKEHYPDITYVFTKTTLDAIHLVEKGRAECAVDILPVISWYLKLCNIDKYKLLITPFKFKVQIMLRKGLEDIRDRLNRAIDSLSEKEKEEIVKRYIVFQVYPASKNSDGKYLFLIMIFTGVIVYLIMLVASYKSKANYDGLTKILNRGAVEEVFKHIVSHHGGSVIFFDIDHFKQINDTYGHEFGDYVLKKIASLVRNNIRSTDIFGRWGGEEFLIVLPETNYYNALKVAEKIRKIIENSRFEGVKVTISLGVTSFKKGEDVDTIIQRVDKALYSAKNSGRNQVKGIYD